MSMLNSLKSRYILAGMALGVTFIVIASCERATGPVAKLAKSGAEFVAISEPMLRQVYEDEQRACLALAKQEQEPCIAKVRVRWVPVRAKLSEVRTAWCDLEPEKCK